MISLTLRASFLASASVLLACASAQAAPSPRELLELADLSSVSISPDGSTVAFRLERASVERNTYDSVWFVEPVAGGTAPRRLADGGPPPHNDQGGATSTPPIWSPDGRWIYYQALIDGQVQVWRAAADGSRAEAITHDPADVQAFAVNPDGSSLLYRVGATREAILEAEQTEYDQGIRIDATVPVGQPLFRSGYVNGRLATQRFTNDWSSRGPLLGQTVPSWKWVDLASLETRDATSTELRAASGRLPTVTTSMIEAVGVAFSSRSPDSGAIVEALFAGKAKTLQVRRPDGSRLICRVPRCTDVDVVAAVWRPGHDQVVFSTTDHDRGRGQSLLLWDLSTGTVRLIVRSAGLLAGGRDVGWNNSCAVGERYAVCVAADADTPPRLERVDLETGERAVLFDPNAALAAEAGPHAAFMAWKDPAGEVFTGEYFPPAVVGSGVPAPLFITYYSCGGYLRGGAGDEWPLASLAGAGIAALCVNEPALNLPHLDQLERYQTAISGIRTVIDDLARSGQIDPHRVGIGGLSFGSEVAMWVAMRSNLVSAVSVTSPSVTPTYFWAHSVKGAGFRADLRGMWGVGSPEETPDRWKLLSPALNLDKLHAAILMQMPEQEYLDTIDYISPLMASSTPIEVYAFPNEPHQKVQPRHKFAAYERNLDWFRFWLQGYVDPDPTKAAQYQRWETMRVKAAQGQPTPSG
ncbi:MAG: Atxe2 family lasso peptide isopeptidase [Caulobacteraceae bacterium]|nr:Atxe2 family lasso peptide isopeptidase [Caulobacteraceae bacterium]